MARLSVTSLSLMPGGKLIGKTDAFGEVDGKLLPPNQSYHLQSPQLESGTKFTLKENELVYRLNTSKSIAIPEIVITASKKDYVAVRGYFNGLVTNTGVINLYMDGIINYIFDRKSQKLVTEVIEQYRTFILPQKEFDYVAMSDVVFDGLIDLPTVKNIGKLDQDQFTKIENPSEDQVTYASSTSKYVEKDFKFLGFFINNIKVAEVFNFKGEKPLPTKLYEYSLSKSLNVKMKNDPAFAQLTINGNFYTLSVHSLNKAEFPKGVKFKRKVSNFKEAYWKGNQLESLFQFLSERFSNFQQTKNIRTIENR